MPRERFATFLETASKRWRIPVGLLAAQIDVESGFDQFKKSDRGIGLFQIAQPVAFRIGKEYSIPASPLENAEININLGAAFMRSLYYQSFETSKRQGYGDALMKYYAIMQDVDPRKMSPEMAERAAKYATKVVTDFERVGNWNQLEAPTVEARKAEKKIFAEPILLGLGLVPLLLIVGLGYMIFRKR